MAFEIYVIRLTHHGSRRLVRPRFEALGYCGCMAMKSKWVLVFEECFVLEAFYSSSLIELNWQN